MCAYVYVSVNGWVMNSQGFYCVVLHKRKFGYFVLPAGGGCFFSLLLLFGNEINVLPFLDRETIS